MRVPFDAWEKKVYCDYHRTAKMISYYYSTAEIHFASSTPFQLPLLFLEFVFIFLERGNIYLYGHLSLICHLKENKMGKIEKLKTSGV